MAIVKSVVAIVNIVVAQIKQVVEIVRPLPSSPLFMDTYAYNL